MRLSMSSLQSVVGLIAGITSIAGAAYSTVRHFAPGDEDGEIAAVVREAHTDKPVGGARIEVLTPDDVLVTTVTADPDGAVRRTLAEGRYRLRVTHPRFEDTVRDAEVRSGETADVHVVLTERPARAEATARADVRSRSERAQRQRIADANRAVDRGMDAAHRFLRRLGL